MEYSLIVLAGLFCLSAAYYDWDWFMNSRRVRLLISLFGRQKVRWFYGIFGSCFCVFGVAGLVRFF